MAAKRITSTGGGAASARAWGGVWVRRLAWSAGLVFAAYFAVEGGEYGTTDLLAQRETLADLEAELALLRDTVAVLDSTLKLVRTDAWTLERIAREEYGLVRGTGELLYWVEEPRDTMRAAIGVDSGG